jgi:hypothetical protein
MYSQQELDDAVASGVISLEAANSLRAHIERQRSTAIPDEEQFRLITGFNDIFVAIAAAILLFAVGWIGQSIGQNAGLAIEGDGPSFVGPLLIAGTSWALALFFTARRRMALPSILLLLSFVIGVFAATAFVLVGAFGGERLNHNNVLGGIIAAVSGTVAAGAAWLHWRRFKVPITIAAGAASVVALVMALIATVLGKDAENMGTILLGFLLVLGIGVFLFAMWWDASDPSRETRRADVAFWLHLLAAPMIVHPVFKLLGLTDGGGSVAGAVIVLGVYVLFGLTALAVDRRALLVSALAYVLWALSRLFEQAGAVELNFALTALVIGSALLLLSAFWHSARRAVVRPLPAGVQAKLPLLDRPSAMAAAA